MIPDTTNIPYIHHLQMQQHPPPDWHPTPGLIGTTHPQPDFHAGIQIHPHGHSESVGFDWPVSHGIIHGGYDHSTGGHSTWTIGGEVHFGGTH